VTAAAIGLSFWFLIEAGHHLPAGTVYAVFTGLGTAGTVAVEMLVYGEPFHAGKWILIFVVLAGIIGLRMVTPDQDQGKDAGKEQTNEQTG
jgi:paired small multidrug resistance pump